MGKIPISIVIKVQLASHVLKFAICSYCRLDKMGSSYLKNSLGCSLTDEEMKDIPYPKTELMIHISTRVVQAFGLLGTVLIGPVAAVAKSETRNMAGVAQRAKVCGKYGVLLGLVVGPGLSYSRMKSMDADGIDDRCYRLRYNRNQVRVDQGFVVATPAGAVAAAAMGSSPVLGGLLGMTGAIFAVAAYNQSIAVKKPAPAVK